MKKQSNLTMGIICILISGLAFSIMALFVKMSGEVPVMQKIFFRNSIAAFIALFPLLANIKKINFPKSKKEWSVLFMRVIFGTLGLVCNFYAITNINLADASVIQRLSPFVILILSYFIFKEKMTKKEMSAVLIAFLGVLLIIKPSFINFVSIGALVALLGAFFSGAAYASIRYLGIAKVSAEFIVFFFSMFSAIIILPFIIFNYYYMTTNQLIMLICVGIFGAIGQFGLTYAYKFAAAKSLSVFDYSQIIFTGFFGYIFFSEIPDMYSFTGYIIIVLTGFFISYAK